MFFLGSLKSLYCYDYLKYTRCILRSKRSDYTLPYNYTP